MNFNGLRPDARMLRELAILSGWDRTPVLRYMYQPQEGGKYGQGDRATRNLRLEAVAAQNSLMVTSYLHDR